MDIELNSNRLKLRPFLMSDAPSVQKLAGDYAVYKTTLTVPHPYEDGMAESWISTHESEWHEKRSLTLAITASCSDKIIGCISLGISQLHKKAELGYWIGKEYWGCGYCTEAAFEVIRFGFEQLDLNKITSRHMAENLASGRVMIKSGMKKEGTIRQEVFKENQFHDIEVYGLLKSEFVDYNL